MADYSRHKERKPEDTVFEIQRILNEKGFFPLVRWLPNSYKGARTCRVTLYPTQLGTNGKGTDEIYCSASGYAELMERLNNGMLNLRDKSDSFQEETGFIEFPDEMIRSVPEILEDPDPFTAWALPAMGLKDPYSQTMFLSRLATVYGPDCSSFPVVPFADPAEGKIQWLPVYLVVDCITGSNGMAAGNTLEEAMVQGLSEVFERAVSRKLISGEAIPPEIPDEELRQYSFYQLIEQIRAEGKYRVTFYDCSLGKEYPVVATCVANLETGTFGIKLGAHPSFAVAVERTLTEALQGKNMLQFSSTCRVGSAEESNNYHNYPNVSKVGDGIYPMTLFSGKPGWEFHEWKRWEGLDNHGFLQNMLQLLAEEGYRPLFRDTSFLGFPSCHIVVPGLSNLYRVDEMLVRAINSGVRLLPAWRRFPDLTEDEETLLLRMIRFKEHSILENETSAMAQKPIAGIYALNRIAAWLAMKHGEFDNSLHFFSILIKKERDPQQQIYLRAMSQYVTAREKGQDPEQARTLIRKLFREDIAQRVCEDTEDESAVMERQFPRLTCFDCEHCPASGKDCDYANERKILLTAAKSMKQENVSQKKLLQKLCAMMYTE